MMNSHASEMDIQQYVLDRPACEAHVIEHIEGCTGCTARAAGYRSLFSGIRQIPPPRFDFDLAAAVMAQLPQEAQARPRRSLVYLLWSVLCISVAAPIYLFWSYFPAIFRGMMPLAIYLIAITAFIFLLYQGFDIYRKYQKQMRMLDF